jgi:3-deoxy-D-manno-octulosonate 8-phosphate phosphatase (KDO 8-P phosphatase)
LLSGGTVGKQESFMKKELSLPELYKKAARIKLVALDMDGTLTDGSINIGVGGELFKRFNAKDGLGITAARRHGLRISVITGRSGPIIQRRAEELGIGSDVMSDISAKKQALLALAEKYDLSLDEIAFMGDDLNDLPALLAAGLSAAPADAAADVKQNVAYIAPHKGGEGAVRDLLELILKARGIWDVIVEEYTTEGKEDRQ